MAIFRYFWCPLVRVTPILRDIVMPKMTYNKFKIGRIFAKARNAFENKSASDEAKNIKVCLGKRNFILEGGVLIWKRFR